MAPRIRPMTSKQNAPPIHSLYFKSVFIFFLDNVSWVCKPCLNSEPKRACCSMRFLVSWTHPHFGRRVPRLCTAPVENTSRNAVVFCYHGRRGDTYHVRGIDFVSPGRIAFVVSPEPLCVIGFVVRSRRLTPIVYRQLIHLLLALPLLALPTLGQETVFDVPSPDLLDKHKVYGELDGTARPVDPVYTFEPRVVVGLGHGIEAGLNFIGLSEPSSGQVILAPTVKWRLWNSGESAWSFFVGDNVFFPVRKRDHNAANYFYAEFAKVFRRGTWIGGRLRLYEKCGGARATRGRAVCP